MNNRWMQRRLLVMCMGLVSLGGLGGCSKSKDKEGAAATGAAPAAATAPVEQKATAVTIAQEAQTSWIRNFNPLLASSSSRWPTRAGIYEPLFIYNTLKSEYVPWLAEKYSWG